MLVVVRDHKQMSTWMLPQEVVTCKRLILMEMGNNVVEGNVFLLLKVVNNEQMTAICMDIITVITLVSSPVI